jgi:nitroimidazol reductase NimA-like FMN-containing flavoprotein (pyridoxamine 5'-phosphate oxidase superfamily)
MAIPRDLDAARCEALLRSHTVGRVAFCTPAGPQVIPVNYAMLEDSIVLRTAAYSVLGTHARTTTLLAFEIDEIDDENERGWSVVAHGRGHVVEDHEDMAEIRATAPIDSWAGGTRTMFVRLRWDELTGRQVGEG